MFNEYQVYEFLRFKFPEKVNAEIDAKVFCSSNEFMKIQIIYSPSFRFSQLGISRVRALPKI